MPIWGGWWLEYVDYLVAHGHDRASAEADADHIDDRLPEDRSMAAGNDVEPYFSMRWYQPGRTAGEAFDAAKAACARTWRERADAVERLSFEEFAYSHLHGSWTRETIYEEPNEPAKPTAACGRSA